MLPVSIGAVALLVHEVTQHVIHWEADWTRPWPLYKGLLSMAMLAWPFLLLTIIAVLRLRRFYFFRPKVLNVRDIVVWFRRSLLARLHGEESPELLAEKNPKKEDEEGDSLLDTALELLDFVGGIVPVGLWLRARPRMPRTGEWRVRLSNLTEWVVSRVLEEAATMRGRLGQPNSFVRSSPPPTAISRARPMGRAATSPSNSATRGEWRRAGLGGARGAAPFSPNTER